MTDLFSSSQPQQQITLPGTGERCQLHYCPEFLTPQESARLFTLLLQSTPWEESRIRIAGKSVVIPRLNAWYGDEGANYGYSGSRLPLNPWSEPLLQLRQRVEQIATSRFNSALLNQYRSCQDSVAWHSDDEPELGLNPLIASVSLGATRRFQLKQKTSGARYELTLAAGSLLIMSGATQHLWQHRVPKESTPVAPRINITFRRINC